MGTALYVAAGLVSIAFGVALLVNALDIAGSFARNLDGIGEFFRSSSRPKQRWSWMERHGFNPPRKVESALNRLSARMNGVVLIVFGIAVIALELG